MTLCISFFISDTIQNHLEGKVGVISLYYTVNCCYVSKVCTINQQTVSGSTEMYVSPENTEPYTWVRTANYVPNTSAETGSIVLEIHFTIPVGITGDAA